MGSRKQSEKIEKFLPNLMSNGLLERERMDYRLRKVKKMEPKLINNHMNKLSSAIDNLKVDVNTIFEKSKRNNKR